MEALFSSETTKSVEHKPPATYFENTKAMSSLSYVEPSEEKDNFNFQTKPCHPSQVNIIGT